MKNKLALLLLFVSFHLYSRAQECDSIVWNSSRKLTWGDFKAKPESADIAAAKTHYNFSHRWGAHGFTLKTKMVCFFSPCMSWSKNKSSNELLVHEQGHFDIAEYFRRCYNKRIKEAKYSPTTLPTIIKSIYHDIAVECEAVQNKYDNDTDHSRNIKQQAKWLMKINDLLTSVIEYDTEEVVVDLPRF
jgi:hypothetical protein